jgi:hypothetical protein
VTVKPSFVTCHWSFAFERENPCLTAEIAESAEKDKPLKAVLDSLCVPCVLRGKLIFLVTWFSLSGHRNPITNHQSTITRLLLSHL